MLWSPLSSQKVSGERKVQSGEAEQRVQPDAGKLSGGKAGRTQWRRRLTQTLCRMYGRSHSSQARL
jgi:hypothetical protein